MTDQFYSAGMLLADETEAKLREFIECCSFATSGAVITDLDVAKRDHKTLGELRLRLMGCLDLYSL